MSSQVPEFPDYGEGGDLAGARRARRSFRLCVISCVFVTFMLYFSEYFLRYDGPDRIFLSALTLPFPSARATLKSAVKQDEEAREQPTPKYSQALAEREEDDVILAQYDKAVRLDPTNSLFRLRYGCQLYRLGDFAGAAIQFREAGLHPPENALPEYLEAAALASLRDTGTTFDDALAVVARANSGGNKIILPRPIWFPGVLPQAGRQYSALSRMIADEICGPLYRFSGESIDEARRVSQRRQAQAVESWLTNIQRMGERLTSATETQSTIAAMAGIRIQLDAVNAFIEVTPNLDENRKAGLIEKRTRLEQAAKAISAFEAGRDERIEADAESHRFPMRLLVMGGAWICGAHLAAIIIFKILGFRKSAWTLPHSLVGRIVMAAGMMGIVALLFADSGAKMRALSPESYQPLIGGAWRAVIAGLVGFGLIYPLLTLTRAEDASRRSGRPEEMAGTLPPARAAYRRAFASMMVRYYSVLSGLYICASCFWIIGFRVLTGLYPWQLSLLTSGLLSEEMESVQAALALLS